MILPALLAQHLKKKYQACENEQELFEKLKSIPHEFIEFFESACDDETWCEKHKNFITTSMVHIAQQSIAAQLSYEAIQKVAEAIRPHFEIIKDAIPNNLTITAGDAEYHLNSILFGAASPYMNTLIRTKADENGNTILHLKLISEKYFSVFIEHSQKGEIENLWRFLREEIFEIMKQAKETGFEGVVDEAAEVLKRYITPNNVLKLIAETAEEGFYHLHKLCIEFANHITEELGLHFHSDRKDHLEVEILDQRPATLDNYKEIAAAVTYLTFSGIMARDAPFSEIVLMTSHLQGINLAQTTLWSERLLDIPQDIRFLNLTQCSWLTNDRLKTIITHCPNIDSLILRGCANLNYIGWGELYHLKGLELLDLSRCYQLNDGDLLVLAKSTKPLKALSFAECQKLSDNALIDYFKIVTHIEQLNLSYIPLNDNVLIQISYHLPNLRELNLTRCERVTPKGLLHALQNMLKLESLNLTQAAISEDTIALIKANRPQLQTFT